MSPWGWCGLQNRGPLIRFQPPVPSCWRRPMAGLLASNQAMRVRLASPAPISSSRCCDHSTGRSINRPPTAHLDEVFAPTSGRGRWATNPARHVRVVLGAPTRVWDSGCPRECRSRDVGSNPTIRSMFMCVVNPPTDAGAGLRSRRRRFDSCRVDHLAVAECSEAPGFYPGRRRLESCRRVQFVLPCRSTGRTPRSERGDRGSNPREAAFMLF